MHNKIQLIFIRIYFSLISHLFPSLAAISAHRLFHYPINTKRENLGQKTLPKAEKFTIELYKNVTLQGYRWGERDAPIVLLVHGWSTTSQSMSHFTDALLENNFQVITYDALRHGETKSKLADLANWADSVRAAMDHIGQVECIIAHSFGGAAVTVASKHGLNTKKLVFLAPIHTIISISNHFAKRFHIPENIIKKMRSYTWKYNQKRFAYYGDNWEDIFDSSFHVPTLIFHDKDDKEIGLEHSKSLLEKWKWATLKETQGLGHRKILDDESVVKETVKFIQT